MRPWAVAFLLPWLVRAASAQPGGAGIVSGTTVEAVHVLETAAPFDGWSLLACDAREATAVLRRPDGELVLVRAGQRIPPAAERPATDDSATSTRSALVREVLADRLAIDLPRPVTDGPDMVWIHLGQADGTSRLQYLRRVPLPPVLHEQPSSLEGTTAEADRRPSRGRPE